MFRSLSMPAVTVLGLAVSMALPHPADATPGRSKPTVPRPTESRVVPQGNNSSCQVQTRWPGATSLNLAGEPLSCTRVVEHVIEDLEVRPSVVRHLKKNNPMVRWFRAVGRIF